jgi:hypothetical protein
MIRLKGEGRGDPGVKVAPVETGKAPDEPLKLELVVTDLIPQKHQNPCSEPVPLIEELGVEEGGEEPETGRGLREVRIGGTAGKLEGFKGESCGNRKGGGVPFRRVASELDPMISQGGEEDLPAGKRKDGKNRSRNPGMEGEGCTG